MTFIDENCVIFDNDEENKLVYHDKFSKFRNLIDNLLETHLAEIGVTEIQFAEACEAGMDARPENKNVFEKLIAVDDFLTFKKMMIKRNVELELEVVEAMKNAGQTLAGPRSKEEEDLALSAALEHSRSSSSAGGKDGGGKDGREDDDGPIGDNDARKRRELQEAMNLKKAMEANLFEMQLYAKQMELEQIELEKALALSLQLEERRLEKLKLEQELSEAQLELAEKTLEMTQALAQQEAANEGKNRDHNTDSDSNDSGGEREEQNFVLQEREDIRARTGNTPGGKTSESPERKREEGKSSSDSPSSANLSMTSLSGMPSVRSPEGKTSSSSSSSIASSTSSAAKPFDPMSEPMRGMDTASSSKPKETPEERKKRKERKKKKKEKRRREKEARKKEKNGGGGGSDLPPMGRAAHLSKFAPLPTLGAKLENDKRAAQEQFRLNQQENEERKRQQREMEKLAKLDDNEMDRRRDYLKRQRDLLIKKKAEERKQQLNEYESRRKNVNAKEEYLNAKRKAEEMSSSKKSDVGDEKGGAVPKELTAAQKKRRDMMKSLGMQMKTDLVKKEERRINEVQTEQYSALDKQLRLAEQQR
tara:strand:- start:101 stop:1873 length:1773 start_codon:yes stop_codon:yes gene_type:complete